MSKLEVTSNTTEAKEISRASTIGVSRASAFKGCFSLPVQHTLDTRSNGSNGELLERERGDS